MTARVLLDHGEGGAATARLVSEVFLRAFGAPAVLEDAARIAVARSAASEEGVAVDGDPRPLALAPGARLAITTDSFVVRPRFFPGGDIGTLAVAGTVNDLAVSGADPHSLAAAFVLEEGLPVTELERVVASMATTAAQAGVQVVTGDTKVVGRGEADGLFITTTGIGVVPPGRRLSAADCRPGDRVVVSGPVGEHGVAVLVARESLGLTGLRSDCGPVVSLARTLLEAVPATRCMRDPTRGGLATALSELAAASGVGIWLWEAEIPVRAEVRAACDLLGLDPLYAACEGRLVAVVPPDDVDRALAALTALPRGGGAAVVGEVRESAELPAGVGCDVVLETVAGGLRPLYPLEGAQLPRIC